MQERYELESRNSLTCTIANLVLRSDAMQRRWGEHAESHAGRVADAVTVFPVPTVLPSQ